jgi:hypothetical protein
MHGSNFIADESRKSGLAECAKGLQKVEASVISGTSPDGHIYVQSVVFQVGLCPSDAAVRIVQCCFYDSTQTLWPEACEQHTAWIVSIIATAFCFAVRTTATTKTANVLDNLNVPSLYRQVSMRVMHRLGMYYVIERLMMRTA